MFPHARWLMILVALGSGALPAWAQPNPVVGDPGSDVRLTIHARKVLADDPELSPWNLGVIVSARVAVLWGPAPSAEVAFRAEERLRKMIDLVEIHNKLFVSESIEAVPAGPKIQREPLFPLDPLLPPLPADPILTFGAAGTLTAHKQEEPRKTLPASLKDRPAPGVQVLPPEAIQETAGRKLPAGDPGERDLEAAIRTLLQSKVAFKRVEFTLQGRRVYLKSSNSDADALHEAARAISRLPNIEGVILADKAGPR